MSEERNENEVFEEVTQETVSQEEVADVDEAFESTDAVDSTAEVVEETTNTDSTEEATEEEPCTQQEQEGDSVGASQAEEPKKSKKGLIIGLITAGAIVGITCLVLGILAIFTCAFGHNYDTASSADYLYGDCNTPDSVGYGCEKCDDIDYDRTSKYGDHKGSSSGKCRECGASGVNLMKDWIRRTGTYYSSSYGCKSTQKVGTASITFAYMYLTDSGTFGILTDYEGFEFTIILYNDGEHYWALEYDGLEISGNFDAEDITSSTSNLSYSNTNIPASYTSTFTSLAASLLKGACSNMEKVLAGEDFGIDVLGFVNY